jgi:hypothetical protein
MCVFVSIYVGKYSQLKIYHLIKRDEQGSKNLVLSIPIDISIKKLCLVFIRLDSIATSKSRKSIFFIINYSFDIKLNVIFLLTN